MSIKLNLSDLLGFKITLPMPKIGWKGDKEDDDVLQELSDQ